MRWGVRAAMAVTMAVASARGVHGQTISTLEGIVRDETGPVAGARITATDTLTGERRRAITNDGGFFRIIDVTAGRYVVSTALIGHVAVARQVDVLAGQRAYVELVLSTTPQLLESVRV